MAVPLMVQVQGWLTFPYHTGANDVYLYLRVDRLRQIVYISIRLQNTARERGQEELTWNISNYKLAVC